MLDGLYLDSTFPRRRWRRQGRGMRRQDLLGPVLLAVLLLIVLGVLLLPLVLGGHGS